MPVGPVALDVVELEAIWVVVNGVGKELLVVDFEERPG